MNLFARLLKTGPDPRDGLRPLWHRTVEIAREPEWYRDCGVADTVAGRFDMVTAVLSFVLLRLEQAGKKGESALLTELFVEDMDGQLRESGVGDIVVGKHVGKLMEALGGRLAAYREACAAPVNEPLDRAVERNITQSDPSKSPQLAARLRDLAARLAENDPVDMLAGRVER